ncbi:unnamed protein product, partial [Rotaria sp. Silwood2]
MTTVPCALKDYGCSHSVVRVEMAEHYLSKEHQDAVINAACALSSKNHQNNNGDTIARFEEIYEKIDIAAGEIQMLQGDACRLNAELLHVQGSLKPVIRDVSSLKLSIEEQNAFLDAMKSKQEILTQDLASLTQKVEDMQYISYDGTIVWKITNVAEKMGKALFTIPLIFIRNVILLEKTWETIFDN